MDEISDLSKQNLNNFTRNQSIQREIGSRKLTESFHTTKLLKYQTFKKKSSVAELFGNTCYWPGEVIFKGGCMLQRN